MRGSLLMTFDQIEGEIADSYRVYVNGQLRDRHYTSITNLYSTFLELDDVVFIEYLSQATNYSIINVTRTDYTTDSENNDNGIKDIFIDSLEGYGPLSGITFTATTTPDSYKYNYNIDISQSDCFIIGTGFTNPIGDVYDMEIQSDDKIICGGEFISYAGLNKNRIIRLKSNGVNDNTFNIGTGFNDDVFDLIIQPDGKILAAGDFTSYSGETVPRLIRLNTDGTRDTSFNLTGISYGLAIRDIEQQSDGKIYVTPWSTIRRFNSNGVYDNTFVLGIFGPGFGIINDLQLQPDNKLLVGGNFTQYSGLSYNRIVRLTNNGYIDNTFVIGTGFNGDVQSIKIDSNGKILVGGNFTQYSGQTFNRIIRLNSNGTIDTSFNISTGFDSYVFDICIQSDGKILVCGSFNTYQGYSRNGLVRINSDGSIDTTFNVGTGFVSAPLRIRLQSDEKIIVSGQFTSYNGVSANKIIRLNSDGTEDLCP